jgi:type I restriction enzyme, S subunit
MDVRSGYKRTEAGIAPEDWVVTDLSSVCSMRSGEAITAAKIDDVSAYPCYGGNGLRGYTTRFTHDGTYALIGRQGALCGNVVSAKGKFFASEHAVVVTPRPGADIDFLTYVLAEMRLNRYSESSAQPGLSVSKVLKLPIALPNSKSEQTAIARALSDVDALLDELDRLVVKKRDLKQAVMQQLLTGEIRLPGFDGEWEVRRLGDVADTDPENLRSQTRPDFAFNYIALDDVDHGLLRSYTEQRFATAPSRARRKLRLDDVLVSTVRPNLQSHLLFRAEGGNWLCSTGFCVVRCRPGVSHPGYIFFQLFAHEVSRQIEALLTGSNYPAINSGDVRALEIPIPGFAEQTAIATVLSDIDAELRALDARRQKTRDIKQAMMQELLTGETRLPHSGAVNA